MGYDQHTVLDTVAVEPTLNCYFHLANEIYAISKIQLVVYYHCCVLIG